MGTRRRAETTLLTALCTVCLLGCTRETEKANEPAPTGPKEAAEGASRPQTTPDACTGTWNLEFEFPKDAPELELIGNPVQIVIEREAQGYRARGLVAEGVPAEVTMVRPAKATADTCELAVVLEVSATAKNEAGKEESLRERIDLAFRAQAGRGQGKGKLGGRAIRVTAVHGSLVPVEGSRPSMSASAPQKTPQTLEFCCCETVGDFVHQAVESREVCTAETTAGTCLEWSECGVEGAITILERDQGSSSQSWDESTVGPVLWVLSDQEAIPLRLAADPDDESGKLEAFIGEDWTEISSVEVNLARGGSLYYGARAEGALLFRSTVFGHGTEPDEHQARLLRHTFDDAEGDRVQVIETYEGLDPKGKMPAWATIPE